MWITLALIAPQFAQPEEILIPDTRYRAAAPIDVDGDQQKELVMLPVNSNFVLVRKLGQRAELGRSRRFELPDNYSELRGVAADDFDHDGEDELILTCRVDGIWSLSVFDIDLLDGITPLHVFQTASPGEFTATIQIVDFDGDGDNDYLFPDGMVTPSEQGYGLIAKRTGPAEITFDTPVGPGLIEVPVAYADVDGDGLIDMVRRTFQRDFVWQPQLVGGSFGAPVPIDIGTTALATKDVEASDFDGDGVIDFLLSHKGLDQVYFYRGLANGSSWTRRRIPNPPFQDLAVSYDVDLDGDLDVLYFRDLVWSEYLGGLEFGAPQPLLSRSTGLSPNMEHAQVTDLDGDGLEDLLLSRSDFVSDVFVRWRSPNPSEPLGERSRLAHASGSSQSGFRGPFVGGVNGDGQSEIYVGDRRLRSTIGEGFGAPERAHVGSPTQLEFTAQVDLDQDGHRDLVTDTHFWYRYVPDADNGSGLPYSQEPFAIAETVNTTQPVDIDIDGDLDLLAFTSEGLRVCEASSPGIFLPSENRGWALHPSRLGQMFDANGDGVTDCVFSELESGVYRVVFMQAESTGALVDRSILYESSPNAITSIYVADFGGSGTADIVVTRSGSTPPVILRGYGDGQFSDPVVLSQFAQPIVDVGSAPSTPGSPGLDLFFAVSGGGSITPAVYRLPWEGGVNFGAAEFVASTSNGSFATGLAFADVDLDGDHDLVMQHGRRLSIAYSTANLSIGSLSCGGASISNSTGRSGKLRAFGSSSVADNRVRFVSYDLPYSSLCLLLTSQTSGYTVGPGSSVGALCIAGSIGRFLSGGLANPSTSGGNFTATIDLNELPQPTGAVAVQPGDTWFFQNWSRDTLDGTPTSNFSEAVSVTFE